MSIIRDVCLHGYSECEMTQENFDHLDNKMNVLLQEVDSFRLLLPLRNVCFENLCSKCTLTISENASRKIWKFINTLVRYQLDQSDAKFGQLDIRVKSTKPIYGQNAFCAVMINGQKDGSMRKKVLFFEYNNLSASPFMLNTKIKHMINELLVFTKRFPHTCILDVEI
jgi:hypothetical protein